MSEWLSEVDATSYVLLISILVIFGIFALLVFGSLPCTCSLFSLLSSCCERSKRSSRVSDVGQNRIHVIGASLPDPESSYSFSIYPYSSSTPSGQVLVNGQPRPYTVVALTSPVERLPCYYDMAQTHKISQAQGLWQDEPPPSYDALFPTNGSGKQNPDFSKD